MKVRIDKDGFLWLERAGKMKAQRCKSNQGIYKQCGTVSYTEAEGCGDDCPLFGAVLDKHNGRALICFCTGKQIHVAEDCFTDERADDEETQA